MLFRSPSESNKDNEIKKLSKWLSTQKINYNKNEQIMKNEDIRLKWEEFMNKYQELFK